MRKYTVSERLLANDETKFVLHIIKADNYLHDEYSGFTEFYLNNGIFNESTTVASIRTEKIIHILSEEIKEKVVAKND